MGERVKRGVWEPCAELFDGDQVMARGWRCSGCNHAIATNRDEMPPKQCPNCAHEMRTELYLICSQCAELKKVCCFVDGMPWCEECFERALGNGEEKD